MNYNYNYGRDDFQNQTNQIPSMINNNNLNSNNYYVNNYGQSPQSQPNYYPNGPNMTGISQMMPIHHIKNLIPVGPNSNYFYPNAPPTGIYAPPQNNHNYNNYYPNYDGGINYGNR